MVDSLNLYSSLNSISQSMRMALIFGVKCGWFGMQSLNGSVDVLDEFVDTLSSRPKMGRCGT
jgi:hypothetical protein